MRKIQFRELFVLSGVLMGALAGLGSWAGRAGNAQPSGLIQGTASAQEQDEDIAQTARKAFMRGKLASNQKIVEGLSTRNFGLITEGTEEIRALVKGQHWFVLRTPEYQGFSGEMQLAAGRLAQAATEHNIEAAALSYLDLTLNCLDCHRYIEKQKY